MINEADLNPMHPRERAVLRRMELVSSDNIQCASCDSQVGMSVYVMNFPTPGAQCTIIDACPNLECGANATWSVGSEWSPTTVMGEADSIGQAVIEAAGAMRVTRFLFK